MSEEVIILGAGGHAKVIAEILLRSDKKLAGFLDDAVTGTVCGYPVLGRLCDAEKHRDGYAFIIGIGDNRTRMTLARKYRLRWCTATHPASVIASDAVIGEGSVVMPGAVVNPSAVIGTHCIVNSSAVVEHDCTVGDFAHISPGATLCGTVTVGQGTWVGAGATVLNNLTVCPDCVIGAGAVVTRDITERGTYTGIPARLCAI